MDLREGQDRICNIKGRREGQFKEIIILINCTRRTSRRRILNNTEYSFLPFIISCLRLSYIGYFTKLNGYTTLIDF
jgi:hypothetical protein